MKNRILSSGLMTALLLSSAPISANGEGPSQWEWVKPSAITAAALGVGALPLFLLHLRRPDKKFKSRFDVEKLKSNPVSKEGFEQLWYFLSDEVIGQKSEGRKVKASKEDGSLEVSEGADSYGFLGQAHDFIKPAESTAKTLGTLYLGYLFVMKPGALWSLIQPKETATFDGIHPAPAPTAPAPQPAPTTAPQPVGNN